MKFMIQKMPHFKSTIYRFKLGIVLILIFVSCNPAQKKNSKSKNSNCTLDTKNNRIEVGQTVQYTLNCDLSSAYQGKKMVVQYPESLVKITVPDDQSIESVNDSGELTLFLPRQEKISLKLSFRGKKKGKATIQTNLEDINNEWTIDIFLQPPPQPTGLSAVIRIFRTVGIGWNQTPRATSYRLYHQVGGSGSFTLVYEGKFSSYNAINLAVGQYIYQVKACNDSGCSDFSSSTSVTVR